MLAASWSISRGRSIFFSCQVGKYVFQLKMLLHTSGSGGGIIYMSVEEDHPCCMNTVKMAKYPYPCLTCAT